MPTKNTIRRDYLIIRRILQNDYPSKRTLLDYLKRYDTEIGERTFQRDLADIRSNFDIEIRYDEQKNGYFAQTDSTLDFDKLLYFIGLAESSDIILSTIKDKNRLLRHLSVSPNPHAKGVENIGCLLQVIQSQMAVRFDHWNYQTGKSKEYIVNPYLLKEFEGMWYLFAFVDELKVFRTFGLDRISNLTDLHRDHYSKARMINYLDQTEKYILPMALEVNKNMAVELKDLIAKRRKQLNYLKYPGFIRF